MAAVKLVGFLVVVLAGVALASLSLRIVLDSDDESTADDVAGGPPTTVVNGRSVPLMQVPDCPAEGECPAGAVTIGLDPYVLNVDPRVEVLAANVTDQVFAAGQVGPVDRAFVVENVDPAVLLAGRSGSSFIAITGPSIENTVAEPTIEQLYTVCVSIADAQAYPRCAALNESTADEPAGG